MTSKKNIRRVANALIAVGLVIACVVVYQLWGSNLVSAVVASGERSSLQEKFKEPTAFIASQQEPPTGTSFALMSIPKIGVKDVPVVQGVEDGELAKGIGHYPKTAMPGGIGNFAVAGHRATHGEPFATFENLRAGDKVYVETWDATYVYSLEYDIKVKPTGTWVIDKNPKTLPLDNNRKLITLTTCDPKWNSTHRWVWWGSLSEIKQKKH